MRAEFFWRDPAKNEVDIILPEKVPVPVEVKYGKIDTGGVETFMRKSGARKGYVVSYDREESRRVAGGKVEVVPAWRFLMGARGGQG